VLISYFIWHSKGTHEDAKDKAFSALAAELSEVADKSKVVINAIADGVVAIDSSGTIQLINPAAQAALGWSQNDALTLDYKSVLKLGNQKGEPFEDAANPVQQVLATNQTIVNNDATITTNSGKQVMVSLVISPAGSHGSGAIVVFRDITQQKAEERQQGEFISTASHEMRTPVASIEGYLGLALNPQTAAIDDKARQYLTKAHESAQHLGRLFQDLLDITKIEDGRITNNPGIVDVVAFAADVVAGFEVKAKEKGLILLFKPGTSGDSPAADISKRLSPVFYISADIDHLREVLSNLVDNGIKYTPEGSVTVDVAGDDKSVTISIHDSGIGIPREDVGHLFQKFYRVDNSATREIGGTGLGLYLCRRLVESMDGKIWVESEFGKGSTFFIQFNRVSHEEAVAQMEASAAKKMEEIDSSSVRVLDMPQNTASDAAAVAIPEQPATVAAAPIDSLTPANIPVQTVQPQPQQVQYQDQMPQQVMPIPEQPAAAAPGVPQQPQTQQQYPQQPPIQQNQT
jgi:PAS domain S-box-containing protein